MTVPAVRRFAAGLMLFVLAGCSDTPTVPPGKTPAGAPQKTPAPPPIPPRPPQ